VKQSQSHERDDQQKTGDHNGYDPNASIRTTLFYAVYLMRHTVLPLAADSGARALLHEQRADRILWYFLSNFCPNHGTVEETLVSSGTPMKRAILKEAGAVTENCHAA
jgi:hypothetical protein